MPAADCDQASAAAAATDAKVPKQGRRFQDWQDVWYMVHLEQGRGGGQEDRLDTGIGEDTSEVGCEARRKVAPRRLPL